MKKMELAIYWIGTIAGIICGIVGTILNVKNLIALIDLT